MKRLMIGLGLMMVGINAFAHGGHDSSFLSIAMHPLTGWDHLLAMLLVGVLMTKYMHQGGWRLPVSFVITFGLGLFSSALGNLINIPFDLNYLVWTSLVIFSIASLMERFVPINGLIVLVGVFGFAHGYVHAQELMLTNWVFYAVLLITTAALHTIGFFASSYLESKFSMALRAFIVFSGVAGVVAIVAA